MLCCTYAHTHIRIHAHTHTRTYTQTHKCISNKTRSITHSEKALLFFNGRTTLPGRLIWNIKETKAGQSLKVPRVYCVISGIAAQESWGWSQPRCQCQQVLNARTLHVTAGLSCVKRERERESGEERERVRVGYMPSSA